MAGDEPTRVRSIQDIPGWFPWIDRRVFEHFLSEDAVVSRGDLVEIGVYLGKSAALIGRYKRPEETFTVCDLFNAHETDALNQEENSRSYAGLTRDSFERNYLALRGELPVVVEGLSSTILDHVKPSSARFVHVDGSHLYEHVVVDLESARTMLLPEAVVALDDFRSVHTPGVSAAVWEAVFGKGLRPICLTTQKMYATFGDPAPHRERLEHWLVQSGRDLWETQVIAGAPVVRIMTDPPGAPASAVTRADINRLTAATRRNGQRLSAEMSELAKAVGSVERKVSSVRREVAELKQSRGSGVQRAVLRMTRAIPGKRTQR